MFLKPIITLIILLKINSQTNTDIHAIYRVILELGD